MRRLISIMLIAGPLAMLGVPAGAHAAGAARHHVAPSPVVVEWFSTAHAAAGQQVTVYARLLLQNKPLTGAMLTAKVRAGTRTVATVHGSQTTAKGIASARFQIPRSAVGRTFRVTVTLDYKGHKYVGRDDLKLVK